MWKFLTSPFRKYTSELTMLVFAAVFFVIASNTQTGWLFILSALLLGLLVISSITSHQALKHITVRRLAIEPSFRGQELTISLEITNSAGSDCHHLLLLETLPDELNPLLHDSEQIYPITINTKVNNYLSYFYSRPENRRLLKLVVPLIPAKQTITVSYKLVARARGVFTLRSLFLRTASPFGFFAVQKKLKEPVEIVVYPVGPKPNNPALRRRHDYLQPNNALTRGAGQDLYGLRPYQTGEDIRLVHWASSAKHQSLMIREFHDTGNSQLLVVIDNNLQDVFGPSGATNLENAISIAASLAKLRRISGNQVQLAYFTTQATEENEHQAMSLVINDASTELSALQTLARIKPISWADRKELWKQITPLCGRERTIIILTMNAFLKPDLIRKIIPNWQRCLLVLFAANEHSIEELYTLHPTFEDFFTCIEALQEYSFQSILHLPNDDLADTLGQILQ